MSHGVETERRRQLMACALQRFARHGYHAAKISDIVADAGVAQGTFYWHFKSKEAVALELVAEGRRQLTEVIAQGYRRSGGTLPDMVRASEQLFADLYRFAEGNRQWMELLLGGLQGSEAVSAAIAETRLALEQAFVANIERAVELGMLPRDMDAALRAAMLMSLVEGLIGRWLLSPRLPGSGVAGRTAEQLAAETARFEFYGLPGGV
ncbi:TetR/AcrR family transcriptional regulator [Paenibacillus albicereus]|uniref:TetR/AcrR family transcriptional regulator n=1 Tax=Paenibacillus albicereus TaxID=2726185 RepID=A0A6H2H2L3_9BACL|nr:TetR/AcrR family transcriptional regulator [Paenibacillus albicereus]QJC53920.1 TetR/AcrR family transcriptional regulator [Paenibacillus albicereus]